MISIPDLPDADRTALLDGKIKDTRRPYQKTYKGADQRATLATKLGVPAGSVDRLATVADLCRLYKVTPRVAQLMYIAGIRSVKTLSGRTAEALTEEIARINDSRHVTENLPTQGEVAGWIKDAKVLKSEDWEQTRKWASIP